MRKSDRDLQDLRMMRMKRSSSRSDWTNTVSRVGCSPCVCVWQGQNQGSKGVLMNCLLCIKYGGVFRHQKLQHWIVSLYLYTTSISTSLLHTEFIISPKPNQGLHGTCRGGGLEIGSTGIDAALVPRNKTATNFLF